MVETVSIAQAGAIVEIRLNRPQKKNALTGDMYDAITAELRAGCDRETVRVFLITAEGAAFTAGNDIGDFLGSSGDFATSPQARFVHAIANCSKPIVAAVQGFAVGVGMTMLLHCDLVYASPDARLSVPFVAMGLVPEAGSSLLMPLLFGPQNAARLLLLGEEMTADEAHRAGLVSAVVPLDSLRDYARERAARLAAKPPLALAAARALMRANRGELDAHMLRELEAFGRAVRGPEAREAFTAFLEKRAPNFAAEPLPIS